MQVTLEDLKQDKELLDTLQVSLQFLPWQGTAGSHGR
jgi:hypothetical protein